MKADEGGLTRKTLGDSLYERLLDDIVRMRYAPGEKLSEMRIVERYGVSRAPVRDALGKLERRGLVSIRPQSGTVVSEISCRKALDICGVRMLLECHAVKAAAERIGDEEIAELRRAFAALDALDRTTEEFSLQVSQVDARLHRMIYGLCGNRIIPEIIEHYAPEIRRIIHCNRTLANRSGASLAEMKRIFAALERRDPEAAASAMEEHIRNIGIAAEAIANTP